jgi:hypothetical protein
VEGKRELVQRVSESSVNMFVEKIYEILSMGGGIGWLVCSGSTMQPTDSQIHEVHHTNLICWFELKYLIK